MVYQTLAAVLLMSTVAAAQPPAIGQNGVVNAASQIPPTLAGGTLAPGAKFMVTGVRLQDASLVFAQGNASWAVRVLASAPQQIEAVVPDNVPLGTLELRARGGAYASQPFPVTLVRSSPGLYSRNGHGWGPGRVRNLEQKGIENSFDHSAQPGERVAIAVTGASKNSLPSFSIGDRKAAVISLRTLDDAGTQEFVFAIPPSTPDSCFVPVYAQVAGAPPSNVITIAIHRGGGSCRPSNGSPVPLLSGRTAGVVLLSRIAGLSRNGREKWIDDTGTATFASKGEGPAITPLLMIPPAGTCTAYTGSSQSSFTMPVSISAGLLNDLGEKGLDAGRVLVVQSDEVTREIPFTPGAIGYYNAPLGTDVGKRRPLFLNPGQTFTVTSGGGREVDPFEMRIAMPEPVLWTNRDQIAEVNRSHPVTLTWNPARPEQTIFILAANADQFTTARAMCYCAVNGREGRFTIPAAMLANFPITYDVGGRPVNQLGLAASTGPATVHPFGSGVIVGLGLSINTRIVDFR
jgi:uncharacterized protein (TIGR03437 family)